MTARTPDVIVIDSADAFERGLQRGAAIANQLVEGAAVYLELFAAVGIAEAEVRAHAQQAIEATERWCPALAQEMRGTAEGSGLAVWTIAALNARTEILSTALGSKPGECSTIVSTRKTAVGAQTWDWHEELEHCWHLQRVSGNEREFVGLTEHGILSKIGVNDAGVGIMLNILGHQADRPDGVPVHLVGARVLAEASTLDEAIAILRGAPVSTSSAITVVSPQGAVVVELSPLGAVVVEPSDDVLLHTNHFLDDELSRGEKPGLYDPDSQLRYGVLAERAARAVLPTVASELVPYLVSYPGDAAELCCVPTPGATLGNRWATLATITVDAAARAMTVSVGSPAEAPRAEVTRLRAGDHAPA
jgi:isopenicillin-N N-acyltransferase-like protein